MILVPGSVRSKRAGAIGALLLVLCVVASGCQTAKVGARCRAGAEPARDATHVLTCANGRWRRFVTIGQAAQFILGNRPAKVEATTTATTWLNVDRSDSSELIARVVTGNGPVAAGVDVTFTAPASGPSAVIIGGPVARTGADGLARVRVAPNTLPGSYRVVASVAGVAATARFDIENLVGAPARIEAVSGGGQTVHAGGYFVAPFVVRVTDQHGNPLPGIELGFDYDEDPVAPRYGWTSVSTDTAGLASAYFYGGSSVGDDLVGIGGVLPSGQVLAAWFEYSVVAGEPTSLNLASGASAAAPAGTAFDPIVVTVRDTFGNPVPGVTLTPFQVAGTGGSAVFASPTIVTDDNGEAVIQATAGPTAGQFQIGCWIAGNFQVTDQDNFEVT